MKGRMMRDLCFASTNEALQYLADYTNQKIVIAADEWPKDVKAGGLRKKMGLSADKPLSDQVNPSDVAKFFHQTDEKGRGMVMFAVNTNKDNEFWKKVGDMIENK